MSQLPYLEIDNVAMDTLDSLIGMTYTPSSTCPPENPTPFSVGRPISLHDALISPHYFIPSLPLLPATGSFSIFLLYRYPLLTRRLPSTCLTTLELSAISILVVMAERKVYFQHTLHSPMYTLHLPSTHSISPNLLTKYSC